MEVGPELDKANDISALDPNFDPNESFALGKIAISGRGGLVQHEISAMYGYNLQKEYSYIALGGKVMLNETFGFEIKFIDALTDVETISPWRSNSFLVFSPYIRINY